MLCHFLPGSIHTQACFSPTHCEQDIVINLEDECLKICDAYRIGAGTRMEYLSFGYESLEVIECEWLLGMSLWQC